MRKFYKERMLRMKIKVLTNNNKSTRINEVFPMKIMSKTGEIYIPLMVNITLNLQGNINFYIFVEYFSSEKYEKGWKIKQISNFKIISNYIPNLWDIKCEIKSNEFYVYLRPKACHDKNDYLEEQAIFSGELHKNADCYDYNSSFEEVLENYYYVSNINGIPTKKEIDNMGFIDYNLYKNERNKIYAEEEYENRIKKVKP